VLFKSEGHASHHHASVWNNEVLEPCCEDKDGKEDVVVEETFEHVVLFEFTSIDFVEDLHEHESIEDYCVVQVFACWLREPIHKLIEIQICVSATCSVIRFQAHDRHSPEKQDNHDNYLVDTLTRKVSKHNGIDNWFMLSIRWQVKEGNIWRLSSKGKGS